ncbi:hypothetical protein PHACT_10030 [Pseudohongiella acticola]|uniref:DUF4864 domain-containing protein n=1 Tax=Pseudohongiella acticola TaxID=1524254 RepID=A0A1E8CLZ4_9GAMM|nr:hypothetical protein [Pseudohongiella acticola]OFE13434.1 hypothetical protein PHACT_10030 [Pseudohongiella acticola]
MKKLFLVICLIFPVSTLADGFETKERLRDFSDNLISMFVALEFQKGLDSIKPYWPIPPAEIDSMAAQVKAQWPTLESRFGASVGTEFVKEVGVGQSLTRYYYLQKFENHAIYWQIDAYRPNDLWQINSVSFNNSLESLFE